MDELRVTALGVGHGDAILLQWTEGVAKWTCLVDGGQSPSELLKCLEGECVENIDLLVATHLDSDHLDGLMGVVGRKQIGAYWGPALPAFARHRWLFGHRGTEAVSRGETLEAALAAEGVHDILYPLEGYISSPLNGRGSVSVISPPSRLIRRLLTSDDVAALLVEEPTPMGWMLEPEPPRSLDVPQYLEHLDEALTRAALTPQDVPDALRRELDPPEGLSSLVAEWSKRTGEGPQFFGDSLLNNSSLVIYVVAEIGNRHYRVLLTGDQENWTYLLARNPRGLQADVMKASHHGGRLYVESGPAHDDVVSAVRPQALLISANGQHGLPRSTVRLAAVRWGVSVFCTSRRSLEIVTGENGSDPCCHETFKCQGSRNITLVLDANGIRSDTPACHSGFGRQPGPIIQLQQHIVEPSAVVSHLFEHELRLHIEWVRRRLERIHKEKQACAGELAVGTAPVTEDDLATLAREEGRRSLVANLRAVLSEGMKRGKFWASPSRPYSDSHWHAYACPSKADVKAFLDRLGEKVMILFPQTLGKVERDKDSLVNDLELIGLAEYADALLRIPQDAFRSMIWPWVSKAMKGGKWSCYLHSRGGIALSTRQGVRTLTASLVEAFRRKQGGWSDESLYVDEKPFPFLAPVLVSGKEQNCHTKDYVPLGSHAQANRVLTWLGLEKKEFDHEEWERLRGKMERSSSADGIGLHDVYKVCDGHSHTMAALLARAVSCLW